MSRGWEPNKKAGNVRLAQNFSFYVSLETVSPLSLGDSYRFTVENPARSAIASIIRPHVASTYASLNPALLSSEFVMTGALLDRNTNNDDR
jgi:hypothetical protein